jgi:hypothetical protein
LGASEPKNLQRRGYMTSRIYKRRFGISELLGVSLKIYFVNIKPILIIILCVYLPVAILVSLINPESYLYRSDTPILQAFTINIRISNVIYVIYEAFIGIITLICLTIIIDKTVRNEKIKVLYIFNKSFTKWPSVLYSGILVTIIVLGLTLLFVVPGIIFSTYFSFWLYAVVLRDQKGMGALSYSKKLITGQWWRIFLIYFGLGIIFYIINIPIEYLLKLIPIEKVFIFTNVIVSQIIESIISTLYIVLFINIDVLLNKPESKSLRPTRASSRLGLRL